MARQTLLIVGLLVAASPSYARQQQAGASPEASTARHILELAGEACAIAELK